MLSRRAQGGPTWELRPGEDEEGPYAGPCVMRKEGPGPGHQSRAPREGQAGQDQPPGLRWLSVLLTPHPSDSPHIQTQTRGSTWPGSQARLKAGLFDLLGDTGHWLKGPQFGKVLLGRGQVKEEMASLSGGHLSGGGGWGVEWWCVWGGDDKWHHTGHQSPSLLLPPTTQRLISSIPSPSPPPPESRSDLRVGQGPLHRALCPGSHICEEPPAQIGASLLTRP